MADEMLELGKISGHFGVQGWLKVYSYTEPMEQITQYKTWYLKKADNWKAYQIEQGRRQGKTVVVKIAGFDNNESAATLIGQTVAIQHQQLKKLSNKSYYWVDLIGLAVYNLEQVYFGTVIQLFETGSNDVLEVEDKGKTRLVPYIPDQVIKQVDLQAQRIDVDWDADF